MDEGKQWELPNFCTVLIDTIISYAVFCSVDKSKKLVYLYGFVPISRMLQFR
jgi:hypothetical protein